MNPQRQQLCQTRLYICKASHCFSSSPYFQRNPASSQFVATAEDDGGNELFTLRVVLLGDKGQVKKLAVEGSTTNNFFWIGGALRLVYVARLGSDVGAGENLLKTVQIAAWAGS